MDPADQTDRMFVFAVQIGKNSRSRAREDGKFSWMRILPAAATQAETIEGKIALHRFRRFLPGLVLFGILTPNAHAGPAIGQFEMKDLEVEVGAIEFQSQNAHAFGQPNRKIFDDDGELEFDDNEYTRQRHALEIEVGVTSFLRSRVGIEFEKERFDDPATAALANSFDDLILTEVAFEVVAVAFAPKQYQPGLGFLTEVEFPVQGGDESKSVIFGPIVQYDFGKWQALADLYAVYHFGGGEDDGKFDFQYALRLLYQHTENWGYAVEAYGTVDRLGSSGTLSEEALLFGDHDQHRLGPIVYYTIDTGSSPRGALGLPAREDADNDDGGEEGASLNVGIGWFFGLNDNTPDHTLKWSVEYEF